jgi:GTP cyclohydrolase II
MTCCLWLLALLQEQGLDTVDANRALGLPDDCREYTSVRNILRDLAVRSVRLMVRGAAQQ